MKQYVGLQHPVIPRDRDDGSDENVRPRPINNQCIFKDDGSGIRDTMIDNFDYVLVSEEAWTSLAQKFGLKESQEPVKRKLVERGHLGKYGEVELYYNVM